MIVDQILHYPSYSPCGIFFFLIYIRKYALLSLKNAFKILMSHLNQNMNHKLSIMIPLWFCASLIHLFIIYLKSQLGKKYLCTAWGCITYSMRLYYLASSPSVLLSLFLGGNKFLFFLVRNSRAIVLNTQHKQSIHYQSTPPPQKKTFIALKFYSMKIYIYVDCILYFFLWFMSH